MPNASDKVERLGSRLESDAETRHTKGRKIDRWLFVTFLVVQVVYLIIAFYSLYMVLVNWNEITDIKEGTMATSTPAARGLTARAEMSDLQSGTLPPIDGRVWHGRAERVRS